MMKWIFSRIVRWAQSRCDHAGEHVSFDITESTVETSEKHVMWCHVCGAVAVTSSATANWRTVSTWP